ncbi:MAG: chorismate lyase [Cardiobacteriaceae bacterium]|nr:chorismate lyase [Cardiobacteriaceae bacterium]
MIWLDHPPPGNAALAALMTAQSLTAALKARGARFAVDVRFQGEIDAARLRADERIAGAHYAREVRLLLDDVPVVWARSVCAANAKGWREVLACGNQPLGARLFGGEVEAARSAFRYARLEADGSGTVWIRQSRFTAHGDTLLLSEAFLPGLQEFL